MAAPNFTLVIVTCSGRPPLDGYAYRSMRVAVISDIHGNVAALEAVLPDIAREKVDLIAVCGDVASGPLPVETLHVLRALPDATFVRGNADRSLVAGFDGTPEAEAAGTWRRLVRGAVEPRGSRLPGNFRRNNFDRGGRARPRALLPWVAAQRRRDHDGADTRIATTGVSRRCGGGGRSVRAHTHAVRPDGRPRTRHQPRQRGNALRRAGRILGRDGS